LLKIEEVNERFPTMTYKAWRALRERQGLSAEGGIGNEALPTVESPPESRAGTPTPTDPPIPDTLSTTNDIPPETPSTHTSTDPPTDTPVNNSTIDHPLQHIPTDTPSPSSEKSPEIIISNPLPTSSNRDSTQTLPPASPIQNPGDNCAICIEPLEEEDTVRGLTCGHCYHQSCLDPWLTQRRASCPLCKADYYIPKPRVEMETTAEGQEGWPLFLRSGRRSLATGNLPLNVETQNPGTSSEGRWRRFRNLVRWRRGDRARGSGGVDGSALERGS
jgi:hypothetical protein